MPRSNWKGMITFGLVSIPIILVNSEDTKDKTIFHQIDKKNHARIKYQRINVKTGKEVPWENIVKGYEYAKDQIFIVEEGDLEHIAGESDRNINIDAFIDADSIHHIDIFKTYYLLPDKKGEKGYVILRQALQESNKFGIAKVTISTKEYIGAVGVYDNALALYLLHYHNEIHPLAEFDLPSNDMKKNKVTTKEIKIAKQLIQSMSEKWQPEKYKDEYKEAVHKWADKKAKHLPLEVKKKAPKNTGKMLSFVDLLKQSINNKSKKAIKQQLTPASHKKHSLPKHITRH